MSSRPFEKVADSGSTLPALNSITRPSAQKEAVANLAGAPAADRRLLSLDVFRGLVIAVMTLVNYLAPIKGVPPWAKHWPETLEGYTFVDVVFPAFLFMVGVAIPFALQRRLDRGDLPAALVGKIALRSGALLLLGVITANDHTYASSAAVLSKAWWFSLTLVCAMGIWMDCPSHATVRRSNLHLTIRTLCACGLILLLCLFRSKDEAGQVLWLQHLYWGMLGMIGWAYLVGSLTWLVFRDNSVALMGALGFMLAIFIGGRHGVLDWLAPAQNFVNVGINFGTNPATVLIGVLVGNCLRAPPTTGGPYQRLRWIALFGVGLYLAGTLVRPLHGINKSAHTDAYALVTGGICCCVFALVYWLVDILQVRRGFSWLTPIGQNALLAYLLPYLLTNLFGILGGSLYWSQAGWSGAACAAVLAIVILGLTWLLSRAQIWLRL